MPLRFRRPLAVLLLVWVGGCADRDEPQPAPTATTRNFVIIAGDRVPIDTTVVTYEDEAGYDAYAEKRVFSAGILPSAPSEGCNEPRRFGKRSLPAGRRNREALRGHIRQFVIHYDVCLTSRRCFQVLHDERGLSVHFMLDVDGTIYQTLDLADRARHAGIANDRSVGVEIAHPGAFAPTDESWRRYYRRDPEGNRWLLLPESMDPPPGGPFRLARSDDFGAVINRRPVVMADFTEAQYESLEVLTRFLLEEFPGIRKRVPRDETGKVRRNYLGDKAAVDYAGVLGHWHVSDAKQDPGPAFDWDRILR